MEVKIVQTGTIWASDHGAKAVGSIKVVANNSKMWLHFFLHRLFLFLKPKMICKNICLLTEEAVLCLRIKMKGDEASL